MSLARLLEHATPGPWKRKHEIGMDDSDINTVYRDATDLEKHEKPWMEGKAIAGPPIYRNADARLIALAPELAQLLIDMADWCENVHVAALADREPDYEEMDALLARFAALDGQAKDTT